jgi:competence protein ComGC
MQKKRIVPILGVIVLGVMVFGVHQVYAQGSSMYTGLSQVIAQKFGLDQTKVQAVVDEYKQTQQTAMQQKIQQNESDRLNKLVTDGKITAAQKQAILDEQAKLKSEHPTGSNKNMTADQRKQASTAEQAEIKAWAQAQGIDISYLRMGFGMRGGGFGGHKPMTTPTPTP